MCKVIKNYPHALEFVPKCYKTQKINICDKAVDTYPSTIKFVPECYKTQKCVAEQFIVAFLYLGLFLINVKLKKYVTLLFLYFPFILNCPYTYVTQQMCDEAVDVL